MQKRFVIAAIAALLSIPLAVTAAEGRKKGGGFAAADKNSDGKLDQAEYVAYVKASKSGAGKEDAAIKARFKGLDKDGNGSLSQEEFSAGMKKKKKR